MGTNIDWVPHAPPSFSQKYSRQFEQALRNHIKQFGCQPRHAKLYLAADQKTLDRIEFDDPGCGL